VTGQASMYVAVGGSIGSLCLIVVIVVIAVILRKRYVESIVKILYVFRHKTTKNKSVCRLFNRKTKYIKNNSNQFVNQSNNQSIYQSIGL